MMQNFSTSPFIFIKSIHQNWSLTLSLTVREVLGRYKGSILGILWSFFNPIFMLAVYTFFFSFVFKARWGTGSDSKIEFALILFAGLIVFNLFSECIMQAPAIILSNANYVKKVIFPLEILPIVNLGAACFHLLISFSVWLICYLFFLGVPSITALLLPIILLPITFLILGLSWFLGSLGVYLRDISQITSLLLTALMFMSPIFFPLASLPVEIQPFLLLNPLTPEIEMVRDALIWGKAPSWSFYFAYLFFNIFIAWLGFAWFQKTRKGFADVM